MGPTGSELQVPGGVLRAEMAAMGYETDAACTRNASCAGKFRRRLLSYLADRMGDSELCA